ncbi:GxxExxY protein [bacterium]|nr:GxxExxY protein [bacterium]
MIKAEPPINADERRLELDKITKTVIGCAYTVGNTLGCGFLEKVYENALFYELRKSGLEVGQQYSIKVKYNNIIVGEFTADLLVEKQVLVELKTVKTWDEVHMAQCLNYIKATGLNICLLINFGKSKVEIKRVVCDF